jgi:hypothetical protein
MIDAEVRLGTTGAGRTVRLGAYLAADAEERAHARELAWIKGLRHLPVDGASFRDRFSVRGDSLWWFTEIYLHKTQVVLDIYRTIAALTALIEQERPLSLDIRTRSPLLRQVASGVARRLRVNCDGVPRPTWWRRLSALDLRSRKLTVLAQATPERFRSGARQERSDVAAFIHRAFVGEGGEDGSSETYIGPTLRALEARLPPGAVRYVGVGPATNFRTPRRWTSARHGSALAVPVERYAPLAALSAARAVWRSRYRSFRSMLASPALRDASRIEEIDCWPIVREQLAGVAWLQWPWSVRAMDEAAGALDALQPGVALTYAEAGGWGRALILEARRRGIPTVGLQHGFIYRHWLNYRHDRDEMPEDARSGYPRPSLTLLFDDYAAQHLREAGCFPAASLRVTGSPRLDALVAAMKTLPADAAQQVRRSARVQPDDVFVLVTTKEREARGSLPALVEAAERMPGVTIVIKPHPAETAAAYAALAGRPQVRVLDAATPLAPLLAAARAVVTVNSTVALDAGVVGVPALVIGLPNNLSPFVDAGAMAGSADTAALPSLLERILYDERFRQQLAARREDMLGPIAGASDGLAAARSADAVLELLGHAAPAQRPSEG